MKPIFSLLVFTTTIFATPAFSADFSVKYFRDTLKPYGTTPASALASEVKISGSRGEVLNFTLKVDGNGCAEPKLGELKLVDSKSKTKNSAIHLAARFYEILPFVTTHRSYAGAPLGTHWDPVVQKSKICVSGGGWILGEVVLPSVGAAGKYEGEITLGDGVTIPLSLKLWNLDMPDEPTVALYSELTTWFLLLGHYGKWNEGEEQLAQKYIRRMAEHRMVPIKHWLKVPNLQSGGLDLSTVFFKNVVEPLPEWARISVPFEWPIKASPLTEKYFSEISKELKQAKVRDRAFVYLWDEPRPEDSKDLLAALRMVKRAAPELKVLVTTTYKKELEPYVDIFVPVMDQFDRKGFPPVEDYQRLKSKGKEFWLYNSCMSHGCGNDEDSGSPDWMIDRPGSHVRVLGWLAQHFGMRNLLYYSSDNGYQHFAAGRDPWKDLWDFTGNGDGTLFYPGRPGLQGLSDHQPIDSLRIKLWRQSSFDAEYVQWMKELSKAPSWWEPSLKELVRGIRTWDKSESAYAELREKIGDFLSSQTK